MYHKRFMRYYSVMRVLSKKWMPSLIAVALVLSATVLFRTSRASAACQPPSDFGSVTFSNNVSIPATGTYRAWSRIQIPNSTNNNYMLEIDGTCYTVGANGSLTANTWTWVDYQSGGSKINVALTQGTHTVKMFGTSDGVLLDRVLFTLVTSGSTCTPAPAGNGDDCANPPDTTPPTVSITSPGTGTQTSGTVTINATASDDSGTVSKVEFWIDGVLKTTDTGAPFSYSWDTTTATDGVHSVVAKAFDPSNNSASSTTVILAVNNGKPDFVINGITWTPSAINATNAVTFTATVKNQGTVAGAPGTISFKVDNTVIGTVSSATSLAAGGSRAVTLTTAWAATGGSHTVTATADSTSAVTETDENNNSLALPFTVSSPDTTLPTVTLTAPATGVTVSGNIDLTATASDTGGSGLARVQFYIDSQLVATDTSSPFSYTWDTTKVGDGSHTISATAIDGAGNQKQTAVATVTVKNTVATPKSGDINGDNRVDIIDLNTLAYNYGQSGRTRAQGDLTGDGVVNIFDLQILANGWGK